MFDVWWAAATIKVVCKNCYEPKIFYKLKCLIDMLRNDDDDDVVDK